jgi:hypothetical protein
MLILWSFSFFFKNYKKKYNLVSTFLIKILQKNSKLQSTWLKFCMYISNISINLFHMCFQQKIKILNFFQRFKGEKKSHERGPAIRLLTPNISELFLINIFEINAKFGF